MAGDRPITASALSSSCLRLASAAVFLALALCFCAVSQELGQGAGRPLAQRPLVSSRYVVGWVIFVFDFIQRLFGLCFAPTHLLQLTQLLLHRFQSCERRKRGGHFAQPCEVLAVRSGDERGWGWFVRRRSALFSLQLEVWS
jgi:hypothetical protein